MNWYFWVRATTFLVPILGVTYLKSGAIPAYAKGPKLVIAKKDCRRLVRHQARADLAYRAGVDVRGRQGGAGGFARRFAD